MSMILYKGEAEVVNEMDKGRFSLKMIASMKETRRQRSENNGGRKKGGSGHREELSSKTLSAISYRKDTMRRLRFMLSL